MRNYKGIKYLCTILSFVFLLDLLFFSFGYPQKKDKAYLKELKKYPLPANAKEIILNFSFPTEEMAEKDVYLKNAFALSADRDDNIYVIDKIQSTILKFNKDGKYLKRIGSRGQGPEDLLEPRDAKFDSDGNIVILEGGNRRIQLLNSEGQYLKSFKIFKSYSSFEIYEGNIFLTTFEKRKKGKLIDVIDMKGGFIVSIVDQLDLRDVVEKQWQSVPLSNRISINAKGEIFAAWEIFSEIHKYSSNGKFLNKMKIQYPKIMDKSIYNYKLLKNPSDSSGYKVITKGIQVKEKGDGFYFFTPKPGIEILECSDSGEIINVFWASDPERSNFWDFVVLEDKNMISFYILQIYPNNIVNVYTFKR